LVVPSFVQQHLDITSARCRLFRLRLSGVGYGFSVTGSNLFTYPFYLYPDIYYICYCTERLAYTSSAQQYKNKTVLLASCNTCRFLTYFYRIVLCWLLRPPNSWIKKTAMYT